jgi:hypothetical protein
MLYRAVVVLLASALLAGCGGDRDRGINRDRDRPKSGEPDKPTQKKEKAMRPTDPPPRA